MDKTVRLWDIETNSCLRMFTHSDYGKVMLVSILLALLQTGYLQYIRLSSFVFHLNSYVHTVQSYG